MSTVKVNKIDKRTGSTLELGGPGTAVTLACGATQTGFGRTGTVDWQTTVKTTAFTAVSGEGYFVNTTSGQIIVTLPTGSAGDIIAVKDYAGTFDTNNCRLSPSGSDKINGTADDAYLQSQGLSVTLVFLDSVRGWLAVNDATDDTTGVTPAFVAATGGTITTCGDFKIHTFTSSGCFQVTNAGNSAGSNLISYMVVAGGGGGAFDRGGGGGAGGFREGKGSDQPYTASPLASTTAITATAQTYPITVGAGGTGMSSPPQAPDGNNSIFSTITSTGGGGGGGPGTNDGRDGGSGGGSRDANASGGTGNTPPVNPPQGNSGGGGTSTDGGPGGGGGGATAQGEDGAGNPTPGVRGDGGAGAGTGIHPNPAPAPVGTPGPSPSLRYFAGGGGSGGGSVFPAGGDGGVGGGGAGAANPGSPAAVAGTTNTGGGGGAGNGGGGPTPATHGKAGGSGIVIIRYKFQ